MKEREALRGFLLPFSLISKRRRARKLIDAEKKRGRKEKVRSRRKIGDAKAMPSKLNHGLREGGKTEGAKSHFIPSFLASQPAPSLSAFLPPR